MKDLEFHKIEIAGVFRSRLPQAWLRYGTYIIVLSTLVLFLMAHSIAYPDVVSGPVQVMGEIPVVHLAPQRDGRIQRLYARSGDSVTKGQVLLELENPATYRDVQLVQSWLDSLGNGHSDVKLPVVSYDMHLGEVQPYFQSFWELVLQRALLDSLLPDLAFQSTTQNRLTENGRWSRDSKRLLEELQNSVALGALELERYETLHEKGVISAAEYEQRLQVQLSRKRELTALRQRLGETRLLLLSQEDQRLQQGLELTRELGLLDDRLRHTRLELEQSLEGYQIQYLLTAPFDGILTTLKPLTEFQQVQSGNPILAIVPLGSKSTMGQVSVSALNRGKVRKGQKVLLQLDNYPTAEFGILEGKVGSLNAVPHPETGQYGANIHLASLVTSYGKELPKDEVYLGTGRIVTEDMSLLERLFRGLREQFQR
ncbi:hypothetical protein MTsPCn9_10660 [Croceitalea sp. MTPC9]|uniref:HlyD family secretion protein n=1 Tax=unclassified Croceitalea TaxID=2632280 RepID=UPI002B389162|nr:hypothetical protein MTsPCn6_26580 [Croceitalea sp. MTPC6]GMN16130.1 hypothetical protein MTsPCn9_10660 [Croceitalea sp. MTPC9]